MNKKELLLSRVILEYLRHKEPIGSESLKHLMHTKISSATIRNYFKALADDGLLFQPHISGGRIPTTDALKSYWYKQLNTKDTIELESAQSVKEACFLTDIFCIICSEFSNHLVDITRLDNDKLMLSFENLGIVVDYSSAIERFLHELKGLELSDVRKIAYQVRASALLNALECVQDKELERFSVASMARAYAKHSDERGFYDIIDGDIFDMLECGIYYEDMLPQGYMAIMQDVRLKNKPEKRSRMLCVGALDRDFSHFYACIQS